MSAFASSLHSIHSLSVISNSVDLKSSLRNLELAKDCDSIIPFVGIHPEILAREENANMPRERLDNMIAEIRGLLKFARGIGEVGLDPNYGQMELQEYLLKKILQMAESSMLPITFHCRETVSKILDQLPSYKLRSKILFHWFAGSQSELRRLHAGGMYTSFGPSILFSKRMAGLLLSSDSRFILPETDSPTNFRSVVDSPSTPLLVNSVVFKVGLILGLSFEDTCDLLETNANEYLATQH